MVLLCSQRVRQLRGAIYKQIRIFIEFHRKKFAKYYKISIIGTDADIAIVIVLPRHADVAAIALLFS